MLCNSFALQIGRTALHHAVLDGKTDMVSFLMANFNTNLEAKDAVSVHSTTDYPNCVAVLDTEFMCMVVKVAQ